MSAQWQHTNAVRNASIHEEAIGVVVSLDMCWIKMADPVKACLHRHN